MSEEIKEEVKQEVKEIKCKLCGKTFKSESGLSGHMRLSHDEQRIKTVPDEIGKRLEAVEAVIATTINPGKAIKTEEEVVAALKLLLPAIEKYQISIGIFAQETSWGPRDEKYRIVKNSDLEGGFMQKALRQKAKEL